MKNPYDTYYAVRTKIKAKKARIYKKIDWDEVLNFTSLDQLIIYLKKSEAFKSLLSDVKSDMHRDNLETVLGRYKILEIEELLHYYSATYKEFVKCLLTEADIEDISLILRKIAGNENLKDIEKRLMHSKRHSKIPYDKLLLSKDIRQFIENLKDTPYYNDLSGLTNEDVLKREFHIEMKLYIIYYKTLLEKAEKLSKTDKDAVKDIIGTKIDILNILWIYRAKNYYNIPPAEILNYSLEGGKKLKFDKLKEMCFSDRNVMFDNLDISLDMNYYMFSYLSKNEFENLGLTVSYIYMLDIMLSNLTTIIEGIKYRLTREELKNYLVYRL